jgi:hypothetical protein
VLPWTRQASPLRPSLQRPVHCYISLHGGKKKSSICALPRPLSPRRRREDSLGKCSGRSRMCMPLSGPSAVRRCRVLCAGRASPLDIRRCCRLATHRMRYTRTVCELWSSSKVVAPAALIAEMQSSRPPLPFSLHPHPSAVPPASPLVTGLEGGQPLLPCPLFRSTSRRPTRTGRPYRRTGRLHVSCAWSLSGRRGTSSPMSCLLTIVFRTWTCNAWV